MMLATVRVEGRTRVAMLDGSSFRLGTQATVGEWFDADPAERSSWTGSVAVEDVALQCPVAPRKVICCGLNYRDHIREAGRDTPRYPALFGKFADTLTGPGADIAVPDDAGHVDWEAELAVVISSPIRRGGHAAAAAAIGGYTVANDISMRDWQSRTSQWMQGKVWDATTPVGPFVVTPDTWDPVDGARIECRIGESVVQSSSVDQLLFDPVELVSYASTITELRPGDLVLTGTPGGTGIGLRPPRYLSIGDVMTTSIEGIGSLINRIVADDDADGGKAR